MQVFLMILFAIIAFFTTCLFISIAHRVKHLMEDNLKLEMAERIIDNAVRFVEQENTELSEQEKADKIIQRVDKIFDKRKIELSDIELFTLVGAATFNIEQDVKSVTPESKEEIMNTIAEQLSLLGEIEPDMVVKISPVKKESSDLEKQTEAKITPKNVTAKKKTSKSKKKKATATKKL